MKKLLIVATLALVAVGFAGCKDETPADKIENGTTGLEKKAEETQSLVDKKANEVLEKVNFKAGEVEKPKDHPTH